MPHGNILFCRLQCPTGGKRHNSHIGNSVRVPPFCSHCLLCWKADFLQIKAALSLWTAHLFFLRKKRLCQNRSKAWFAAYHLKIKLMKMSKYVKNMGQFHTLENYLTNLANAIFKQMWIIHFPSIMGWIVGWVLAKEDGVEMACLSLLHLRQ